jgi:hypothetical protein
VGLLLPCSAYDLEDWGGYNRVSFTANISSHDLVSYFWPPFVSATQRGRVHSVMCVWKRKHTAPHRTAPCSTHAHTSHTAQLKPLSRTEHTKHANPMHLPGGVARAALLPLDACTALAASCCRCRPL